MNRESTIHNFPRIVPTLVHVFDFDSGKEGSNILQRSLLRATARDIRAFKFHPFFVLPDALLFLLTSLTRGQ